MCETVAGVQETVAVVSTGSERVECATDAARSAVGSGRFRRSTQEVPVISIVNSMQSTQQNSHSHIREGAIVNVGDCNQRHWKKLQIHLPVSAENLLRFSD